MFKRTSRPGFSGLVKTAIAVLTICFVAYLVLYRPFINRPDPTAPPPSPEPVEPTDTPTATPTPLEVNPPTPTLTLTPILEEIHVGKWNITDICTFSVRTGVQVTGAHISGGSPPYWVEASYAYVENGDYHVRLPKSRATFSGTTAAYYMVTLDPPLNISTGRWVDVTIKMSNPDKAIEWKDRLFFEQTECGQKP